MPRTKKLHHVELLSFLKRPSTIHVLQAGFIRLKGVLRHLTWENKGGYFYVNLIFDSQKKLFDDLDGPSSASYIFPWVIQLHVSRNAGSLYVSGLILRDNPDGTFQRIISFIPSDDEAALALLSKRRREIVVGKEDLRENSIASVLYILLLKLK
jgi:hypothetical protein